MIEKPMLAVAVGDLDAVSYPVIASPKIDGIRCIVDEGRALSRSLKPIPNTYVRTTLEVLSDRFPGVSLDGELLVGETFQDTTSAIMKRSGQPDFVFAAFDAVSFSGPSLEYSERLRRLRLATDIVDDPRVLMVPTETLESVEDVLSYERECLAKGWEGIMLRDPSGPYKFGRSTLREGFLLKLKRFVDSEAEILGFEEQLRNENEATTNALGLTERSHRQEGKVPAGTLGKFLVRDIHSGVEFGIGTGEGLTHALRAEIWEHREEFVGLIVRYKYQPVGVKDAPRLPIFTGFRDLEDLSC